MSKATESMFDGKNVLIPLEEVSYVLKFQNCIEVRFKDSADSLTLVQPDKNAFISAWCRYRGEVEADTLMDLDGAQPAPSVPLIVGHLDLGVGGYIDIETALPDDELATLPKGRHALAIVGTYGVDGYVPCNLSTSTPSVPDFSDAYQGVMEEVAIWKKRALEAEELNRKFISEINGPTHMGEPMPIVPDEPSEDWFDCLIADVSAIPCRYHGDPSYDHDAYWMREEVIRMLEKRKATAPKPEETK